MYSKLIICLTTCCLCGCGGLAPHKNMNNYTNDIAELDKQVQGKFVPIPDNCISLANTFLNAQDVIKTTSSFVSTTAPSKESFDLWYSLAQCSKFYKIQKENSIQMKSDINDYFDNKYSNLKNNIWWKKGLKLFLGLLAELYSSPYQNAKTTITVPRQCKQRDDFLRYYKEHLKQKYPTQMKQVELSSDYYNSLSEAKQKIWSHFYQLEQGVFLQRSKGRHLCDQEVCSFISEQTHVTPSGKCIYPNGGIYLMASGAHSSNVSGTLFGGASNELRWDLKMYNLIFVFKNNFKDAPYVSGSQLGGTHYVYTGVYTYYTIFGNTNSVYSFKEFNWKKATEGLYFYGKRRER